MVRPQLATGFFLASMLPVPALGQNGPLPTATEFAERAEASERAPLFQSEAPLEMTLRTDIRFLRRERSDSIEVEGTVTFVDIDGLEAERPVQVRARGNFRRDRRNCNFPPLRLNFPRRQMEGTVFDGQDRLKLVTPCQDNRDAYQGYIFQEYLAYKVFNLLTPASYRVRLVEITYEDVTGDYDTRTKFGFLIEDDERMAERNRAVYLEVPQMHPALAESDQAILTGMFNYMIGNVDWSAVYFHNVSVIQTEEGRYLTVPYDFDFSGVVDARYASVPPELSSRIRRVRDRLYRDYCRSRLEYAHVVDLFQGKREAVTQLYRSFPYFQDADDAEDTLDFYEEFWEVLEDPGEFEDKILDDCIEMPA